MKTLLAIMFLMTGIMAQASEHEVPAYLVDSVITVTLKNGKTYTFSGNEYMVVKRGKKKKAEEKPEAAKVASSKSQENYVEQKKNRVRAFAGVGPTGFDYSRSGDRVKVKDESGVVGGIGYDRMLDEKWSVGGQAMTNGTFTLGLGLDF